jgi:hypothetical protein
MQEELMLGWDSGDPLFVFAFGSPAALAVQEVEATADEAIKFAEVTGNQASLLLDSCSQAAEDEEDGIEGVAPGTAAGMLTAVLHVRA